VRESLVAGIRRIEHTAVDESNAISFLGDGLRVYSTPPMVHAVEYACFRLIGEHLDSGETSLGIHVAMDHLGATPIGHRVEIAVTVRSVEGHKVTLDAEVRDAVEVVGRGTHVRVVTDVERFRPKVETKRERLDAAGAGKPAWKR
jgi:fluoroacetyl-CoA thioesterase